MKLVEIRFGQDALLAKALQAIAAFCERIPGANVSFSWLAERTLTCYRARSPLMLLLVALDDHEEVHAHCLAFAEDHYGVLVGFCYQTHIDRTWTREDARAILTEGKERLVSWGREIGCKKLRAATQREPRAFARLFGLHKTLSLMEFDLDADPGV